VKKATKTAKYFSGKHLTQVRT